MIIDRARQMFSGSLLMKDCSSGDVSLCLVATNRFFSMNLSYHLFLNPCKFVPSEGVAKGFLRGYQMVGAKMHKQFASKSVGWNL